MAELNFVQVGHYQNGDFIGNALRAQDVYASNDVTAEEHILDESKHLTSGQTALIAGAAQKANLTAVVTNAVISADGTTVNVTFSVYNADADTTTEVIRAIPLASETTAGAMPKESYATIQQLVTDVTNLKAKGGMFIGQSFATKAELDSFVIPETINFNDYTYVLNDETQSGATTIYVCSNIAGESEEPIKGFTFSMVAEHDPVSIATTAIAGIVKGVEAITENNGKVFVELDGTMSVIGWDDLNNSAVKTTGDQSIGGVKTFTAEPVLPSKTADATNDGTKPATEAQVYTVAQVVAGLDNKIDAAYCESEADMAGKNLRNGALVFMAVSNDPVQ